MRYAEPDGTLTEVSGIGYALPDGTVESIKSAWIWSDVDGWLQVFSSGVEFFDDFEREDLGPLWSETRYTGTTPAEIVNGAVRAGTPSTYFGDNAQNQHALVYTEPVLSDDMGVEGVTVTTPPAGYYMAVFLRADLAGENFVIVNASGTAATAGIFTVVDRTFTKQEDVPTSAFVAGDAVMLEVSGNVYTVKRRRGEVVTEVAQWEDSAGIVNVGAGYRRGGVYVVSVRTFSSTTYGPQVDNFAVYDL